MVLAKCYQHEGFVRFPSCQIPRDGAKMSSSEGLFSACFEKVEKADGTGWHQHFLRFPSCERTQNTATVSKNGLQSRTQIARVYIRTGPRTTTTSAAAATTAAAAAAAATATAATATATAAPTDTDTATDTATATATIHEQASAKLLYHNGV